MQRKRKEKPNPFSKILNSLMKEREVTVREAANVAGVGISTLDSWRSGALPQDYMAVKKLAAGLGVTLSFLLTGEEEANSKGKVPAVTEVFQHGDVLFDGFAKISIQRLIPRKKDE